MEAKTVIWELLKDLNRIDLQEHYSMKDFVEAFRKKVGEESWVSAMEHFGLSESMRDWKPKEGY